jgi:hypothetical protein
MIRLWQIINGKKTYIVGTVCIVYLWSQVWAGTLTAQEAFAGTLIALEGMGLRHALPPKNV